MLNLPILRPCTARAPRIMSACLSRIASSVRARDLPTRSRQANQNQRRSDTPQTGHRRSFDRAARPAPRQAGRAAWAGGAREIGFAHRGVGEAPVCEEVGVLREIQNELNWGRLPLQQQKASRRFR